MASSLISPPAAFSSPPIHSDSCIPGSFCFGSPFLKKPQSLSYSYSSSSNPPYSLPRPPDSTICSCRGNSQSPAPTSDSDDRPWFQQFFTSVAQKLEGFLNSLLKKDVEVMESQDKGVAVDDWNWERWKRHFNEVEDQERLILILKSQLTHAIEKEDYEDAARLKVAIAAAAMKDTVGTVGWWAGVSGDKNDPYGCIIRISAEHGRYIARSYSPRQLATSTTGVPLFEIFLTLNEKGEYRHQAVYLKRAAVSGAGPTIFPKSSAAPSSMNKKNLAAGTTDIFAPAVEDDAQDNEDEDEDDPELFSGFQNLLQDMIPGVRIRILKATSPVKFDQDILSKAAELISEEEEDDDEKDIEAELDDTDAEGTEDESSSETEEEKDDGSGNLDREEQSELAVKVVFSHHLLQKLSGIASSRDLVRVPAKLEPKGHKSFTFSIQNDKDLQDSVSKEMPKRKAKTQGYRSVEDVMADLMKFVSKGEKIPVKVILCLLFTFRMYLGLYIGCHGPYISEVIQLKRKFGQWKEDGETKGPSDLHFYEYVEAVKLTGDPYVPAGKVAFRAKIGKRYQLPHKGIIPEEFGVVCIEKILVARYKGQGRLAGPGFQNPRWVDGELVILDGKHFRGRPVVGFVYWAPEYQFVVFFSRLRIQD
ncbi:hypothetical protein Cgig2_019456 [Carnegiea gigantea]|uniref:Protein EXECUTER 1, chloroplastic n=1 Tax=Carnegiea gigantea TaxID=171969 RepID=A0A9Q1QM82_9CARY|nr:hypothetical protein Cgig2_019456 [Carnegiea gigantea]